MVSIRNDTSRREVHNVLDCVNNDMKYPETDIG